MCLKKGGANDITPKLTPGSGSKPYEPRPFKIEGPPSHRKQVSICPNNIILFEKLLDQPPPRLARSFSRIHISRGNEEKGIPTMPTCGVASYRHAYIYVDEWGRRDLHGEDRIKSA